MGPKRCSSIQKYCKDVIGSRRTRGGFCTFNIFILSIETDVQQRGLLNIEHVAFNEETDAHC